MASCLCSRLWRFSPTTPPTGTWMKESLWISSGLSRYHKSVGVQTCVCGCVWVLSQRCLLVQGLLKERPSGQAPQLLMDVRRMFPVTFPYMPPPALHADQLVIPDSLKISFLRKVWPRTCFYNISNAIFVFLKKCKRNSVVAIWFLSLQWQQFSHCALASDIIFKGVFVYNMKRFLSCLTS